VKHAALVLTLLLAACQNSLFSTHSLVSVSSHSPIVHLGGPTLGPRGYYELCSAEHDVCREAAGDGVAQVDGRVRYDPAVATQLATINSAVNRSIRQTSDFEQFGVSDYWSVGGSRGDCEEFALTKKAVLLAQGWPSAALPLALVKTPSGGPHLVLIAKTDEGDMVLDNLTTTVQPWQRTSYTPFTIQSSTDGRIWHWAS
jgi:predicted transglutaminase-like cysteine proteinase